MRYFLELSVNGAVAGALYALAALSFVVVYKATRVMNFALGEFVMFATGIVAAGLHAFGLALVPALAFGGAGMFAVAAGFNRFVVRHLIGRPVIGMIMITIGFGAVLRRSRRSCSAASPATSSCPCRAARWMPAACSFLPTSSWRRRPPSPSSAR